MYRKILLMWQSEIT